MRHALWLEPLGLQVVRQLTERFGGVLGDHQPGDARPQALRVAERVLEQFPLRPVREIDELEDVNPLHGAGEVGVNLDPLGVAGDQKRRILQHVRVLLELQIRGVQVLSRPLVFPGERTLLPDIGPAVPADRRRAALLEGVGIAVRVRLRRRQLTEQRTQIQEMLLRRRPLRQIGGRPLLDEMSGVSGHEYRNAVVAEVLLIGTRLLPGHDAVGRIVGSGSLLTACRRARTMPAVTVTRPKPSYPSRVAVRGSPRASRTLARSTDISRSSNAADETRFDRGVSCVRDDPIRMYPT